jgi:hypothetical protein
MVARLFFGGVVMKRALFAALLAMGANVANGMMKNGGSGTVACFVDSGNSFAVSLERDGGVIRNSSFSLDGFNEEDGSRVFDENIVGFGRIRIEDEDKLMFDTLDNTGGAVTLDSMRETNAVNYLCERLEFPRFPNAHVPENFRGEVFINGRFHCRQRGGLWIRDHGRPHITISRGAQISFGGDR